MLLSMFSWIASYRIIAFVDGCVASNCFFQLFWIAKGSVSNPTSLFWIEVPWIRGHCNWVCEFFFPQKSMVTYYLSFFMFVIYWDTPDNCKIWIKSKMVLFGVSYKLITSRIRLDWALERWNVLDICVVKMILVLCFNVLLCTMKLLRVAIICNFQYLGNVLWNPWFVPSIVSFAILCSHVYKLVVVKCIMLFTSFQIFQELQSTLAPMPN